MILQEIFCSRLSGLQEKIVAAAYLAGLQPPEEESLPGSLAGILAALHDLPPGYAEKMCLELLGADAGVLSPRKARVFLNAVFTPEGAYDRETALPPHTRFFLTARGGRIMRAVVPGFRDQRAALIIKDTYMNAENEKNDLSVTLTLGHIELDLKDFLELQTDSRIEFELPPSFDADLMLADKSWARVEVSMTGSGLSLRIKNIAEIDVQLNGAAEAV